MSLPSVRTKLNECRIRRMHVGDMEADVAALWWRDYHHEQAALAAGYDTNPADWGHLADDAWGEVAVARRHRLDNITARRSSLRLRLAQEDQSRILAGGGFDIQAARERQPEGVARIGENAA